jgi:pyridoxamine 5'-phosphate oxidase
MRERYQATGLAESALATQPYEQFGRWFADAVRARDGGLLSEPNAMIVSTVDAKGAPRSRTVLLKGYDLRGFVFFTNYGSGKGADLTANPAVSLLFPWHAIARQVIVSGTAARVSREESAVYFHTRPHGSQVGAWASAQSTVVSSRKVLEQSFAEMEERWPEGTEVPVPPFWGGFRVEAHTVEFWQGRENRLHDRLRYVRADDAWEIERLAP